MPRVQPEQPGNGSNRFSRNPRNPRSTRGDRIGWSNRIDGSDWCDWTDRNTRNTRDNWCNRGNGSNRSNWCKVRSTGPTGSSAISTGGGYFFSTSTSTIAANANIPINWGSTVYGTGVSLTSATTFTVSTPGIYLVSYYFQGDANGGNEVVSVRLLLNGTQVTGSFIQNVTTSTVIEPAISNTLLVNVASANSTLVLQNGPLGVGHVTTIAGTITASLNVVRIL